jgi:phosphate-selective porin
MRRARLYVSGTALHNEFSYMLEGEFANSGNSYRDDGSEESPRLLDAYIDWNASDWGALRIGQFKPAVSRSWNTHAAHLQFLDRSVISDISDFKRQQGLSGRAELGGVELGAAVFNGSFGNDGANLSNGDTRHLFVVNARFNAMGEMNPYVEGDIDWTEGMALNIGAAYAHHKAGADGVVDGVRRDVVNADLNFKSNGLSLQGEFFWNKLEVNGEKWNPLGFYAQAGYFLVPGTIELAARYSYGDTDQSPLVVNGVLVDDINQVSVALNYYWWKHNLKAQLGYDYLNVEQASSVGGDDINTNRWMLQLSSYF